MKQFEDIELLKNFDNRRSDVLAEFYNRYSYLVYGVCLKYLESKDESLDTVVEIFESLLDKIPENEITNFKSWLYSVSKNHCLMKLRKTKRQQESINNHLAAKQEYFDPEKHEEELILNKKIEKALCELTEEQRICIELFYYNQKSYFEISNQTGFSVKSVKSYLQNGKIKLKKLIENQI